MMPPDDLVGEFASTFREWHYLVAGLAVGFALGFYAGVRLLLMAGGQGIPPEER